MKTQILSAVMLAAALGPVAVSQAPQYAQTNLTSNVAGAAPVTDPNLVNPWGLSRATNGSWWVSDNGTGLSTLYDGTGAIRPLVVKIPSGDLNLSPLGSPTGTIFNGFPDFAVSPGKPSVFLFATEDGTISGWNPGVLATSAIVEVNEHSNSVFKGLTMAQATVGERESEEGQAPQTTANYLYAADFRKETLAVYDTTFQHATGLEGRIARTLSLASRRGYAPFNVQNLGGNLYVTLARQDAAKHDEIPGAGFGLVVSMTPEGRLLQIFQTGAFLNAPWGMVIAPSDFGAYSHDLLVGNFGDGTISAFNPVTGKFLGQLKDKTGNLIAISGLWALSFGSAGASGPADTLYFAAGPNGEKNGLFGTVTALTNPQGNDQ